MNPTWSEQPLCLHYIQLHPDNPVYNDGCSCDELENVYCPFPKTGMAQCPKYIAMEAQ